MTALMHEAEKIDDILFDDIINIEWKGLSATTGKPVRTYMVAAFPRDDLAGLSRNSLAKGTGQSF